jgi:hypothetical protein
MRRIGADEVYQALRKTIDLSQGKKSSPLEIIK